MKNAIATLAILLLVQLMGGCTATTRITSDPTGASVLVDGRPVGETPLTAEISNKGTPWASWEIGARKPGYVAEMRKYKRPPFFHDSNNNIPKDIHFVLRPISETHQRLPKKDLITEEGFGYMKLFASEAPVDIYIDNELIGQIVGDKPFVKKTGAGKRTIMAKKQFFEPISVTATITKDEVFEYTFELVNASGWRTEKGGQGEIVQARGALAILTESNNLQVFLDDQELVVPIVLDVPAGVYRLRVIAGGSEKQRTVTIQPNGKTVVNLDEL